MGNTHNVPDIVVRQEDGKTFYDIPVPKPEVLQEITIIVNRGKGDEIIKEEG
jgi:hypothetical protein